MRVEIYLKVQTQFHCPLYHIYPNYSDTASIVDQDQTAHKDCSRSALFASAFIKYSIHVINFKDASGRFFFHFLEVFEKCIGYMRKFFIHVLEVSKFW